MRLAQANCCLLQAVVTSILALSPRPQSCVLYHSGLAGNGVLRWCRPFATWTGASGTGAACWWSVLATSSDVPSVPTETLGASRSKLTILPVSEPLQHTGSHTKREILTLHCSCPVSALEATCLRALKPLPSSALLCCAANWINLSLVIRSVLQQAAADPVPWP